MRSRDWGFRKRPPPARSFPPASDVGVAMAAVLPSRLSEPCGPRRASGADDPLSPTVTQNHDPHFYPLIPLRPNLMTRG
jgi:hypothetical protein